MNDQEMKSSLKTAGFPRSGNTFLNFVLKSLYFPTESINGTRHEANMFDRYAKLLVPLRNPLDCIASWNKYIPQFVVYSMVIERNLKEDIKFYLRFHNKVLSAGDGAVIMDFDKFTTDIDYTKNRVLENFGYTTDVSLTIDSAKEAMPKENEDFADNLPRNDKAELDAIKQQLMNTPGFDQCVELYNQLKG